MYTVFYMNIMPRTANAILHCVCQGCSDHVQIYIFVFPFNLALENECIQCSSVIDILCSCSYSKKKVEKINKICI